MEIQEIKKLEKNLTKYFCIYCDFTCFQKCDWNRHIIRPKHLKSIERKSLLTKKLEKNFLCECGKSFLSNAGLWKHKQKCNFHLIEKTSDNSDMKNLTNLVLEVVVEYLFIERYLKNILVLHSFAYNY